MQYGNWWLTEQLQGMRYEDLRRAVQRERLLFEHELDLWSVLRRAIARRLPRSSATTARHERVLCADADVAPRAAA